MFSKQIENRFSMQNYMANWAIESKIAAGIVTTTTND